VDLADELVEVADVDELLVLGRQTIGHGYGWPERASGKTGLRTRAAARAARASRSSSSSRAASWTGTDTASRAASATRSSGTGWPAKSHITVRSLGSAWKQRPWSTDQRRPSSPSRQWPPLRSALLAIRSKRHILFRAAWCSGRSSRVK